MVARNNDYLVIGKPDDMGIANDYAIAERDNYEYLGREGGADDARRAMSQSAQAALGRGGPAANYTQADADLAMAMTSRGQQTDLLGRFADQQFGAATPQQMQLQASTANAIGAQRSLANSGRGFGATTMAGRLGDQRAWQLQHQGNQQLGIQRAQDIAAARDMQAALIGRMQQQDLGTRESLQNRSLHDAQMADEQRARNDAMSRYYLSERYKIGQGQLGANMAYESQDAANRLGYSNLEQQADERRAARAEALENQVISGAAQGATFAAQRIGESARSDDTTPKRGGIIRDNPY